MVHGASEHNNEVYRTLSDEKIAELASAGDVRALDHLIRKYKSLVRIKARSFFLIGADQEDIIQEGMIGLFKAIKDFDSTRNDNFKVFAEICIKRHIITAINSATRQKHIPLNSYISLNKPIFEDQSEQTLLDILTAKQNTNPELIIISKEEFDTKRKILGQVVSDFELQVLESYLTGASYQEIADELDKPIKSIDNALQRMKRKIEKYLETEIGDK